MELQFLSDVVITADHSFIRFHGRNTKGHYWYNYLYSKQELEPWVEKVNRIKNETKVLRVYFNNHYGGKAVVYALQFKEMTGTSLTELEVRALEHAEKYSPKENNSIAKITIIHELFAHVLSCLLILLYYNF